MTSLTPDRIEDVVARLLGLHEKMLCAVKQQRPYPVKIALGDSDRVAVLDGALTIERLITELKEVREALTDARTAIASLDEYALGGVEVANVYTGDPDGQYPIRDELLAKIDAALTPVSKGDEM